MKSTKSFIQTIRYTIAAVLAILTFTSCKKFIEIDEPADQIVSSSIFRDDASAEAAIRGIYSEMMNSSRQFTSGYTTLFAGMAADELYYYSPSNRDEFVNNQITLSNHNLLTSSFWQPAYRYIYTANLCIEGLQQSAGVSPQIRNRLIGEAKFIRAFSYFHLVNLFGDVPLVLTTDYKTNATLPRTDTSKVFQQIIFDLEEAKALLPSTYPTPVKARPNKYAAAALLAKVYLYRRDWNNAEATSFLIISSGQYSLETNLANVFLQTSNESIWQLYPSNANFNTYEGNQIIPSSNSSSPTFLMRPGLLNAFEAGDLRKLNWTKSRTFSSQTLWYPYKYKVRGGNSSVPLTECYSIFRLSDIYLIRAEARTQLNNVTGAQGDINIVRNRAGLSNTMANTQATLLLAIEQERRIELFAEWGNRWYDLKRTNRVNDIISVLKPATWNLTDALWPIPIDQITRNPFLTQNAGY